MNERKKRSPIWNKMTDLEFSNLVKKSNTFSEILKHFGLNNKGGNYKTLKRRAEKIGVDISHIKDGVKSNYGRKFNSNKQDISAIMIENSTYCRKHLKKRIIDESIIEYICDECKGLPTWNGKELSLVLDHINGIPNDNRKENLRFLCPNCNSQTITFSGKKNKMKINPRKVCPSCGGNKHIYSKQCFECRTKKGSS